MATFTLASKEDDQLMGDKQTPTKRPTSTSFEPPGPPLRRPRTSRQTFDHSNHINRVLFSSAADDQAATHETAVDSFTTPPNSPSRLHRRRMAPENNGITGHTTNEANHGVEDPDHHFANPGLMQLPAAAARTVPVFTQRLVREPEVIDHDGHIVAADHRLPATLTPQVAPFERTHPRRQRTNAVAIPLNGQSIIQFGK